MTMMSKVFWLRGFGGFGGGIVMEGGGWRVNGGGWGWGGLKV